MTIKDTQALGRQRAKPSKTKARSSHRPERTACTTVHHYNGTQCCSTVNIPWPPESIGTNTV